MSDRAAAPKAGRITITPIPRLEDERLLRGGAVFIADLNFPAQAHAAFVRSPHGHARLTGIDIATARAAPGVAAVLTWRDVIADGLGGVPWEVRPPGSAADAPLGDPGICPPQPLMADGTVRFVGEIVAMVIADTPAQALDAAELVEIGYDDLPAVADVAAAATPGAAQLWPQFPGNRCFTVRFGDPAAAAAGFDRAAFVARIDCVNNRLIGNPMETRGYIGRYEAATGRYILDAAAGKPHPIKHTIADYVFRVPADRIVVKVPHVGGGFGVKNVLYPEECLVLWAAEKTRRPVKWIAARTEGFLSDIAGRDQVSTGEMAFAADGTILAARVKALGNLGAYLAPRGVMPLRNTGVVMPQVYAVRAIDFEMQAIFTNTAPTCSFRGAGQPEMTYLIERLIDQGARGLSLDPAKIRQHNLVPAAAMPYRSPTGVTYDSGDFALAMQAALGAADLPGFAARRAASAARGLRRGIGISNCLEICGAGFGETSRLEVAADGTITLLIGTQSSGQGHATVYAQLAAAKLGIEAARFRIVQGDTERIATGNGTGASRSLTIGGSATLLAADALIEEGRKLAAQMLEAATEDIAYARGVFEVAGTDRRIDLWSIAADRPLAAARMFTPPDGTFPYGCHVAEIEVDTETGEVAVVKYSVSHDAGFAVNPAIVDGQAHGGISLGIGQALMEHGIYDGDSGQLLSGSFMDYALPRADDLPLIKVVHVEVPSTNNLLGSKGVGESGTLGAPPAVINALLDALAPLGVRHVEMPATPQRVWRAIRDARHDHQEQG